MAILNPSNRRPSWSQVALLSGVLLLFACRDHDAHSGSVPTAETAGEESVQATALLSDANPPSLNIATAEECPPYQQADLVEPVRISPVGPDGGVLETQLVVALKERCVPVFEDTAWTLQKLPLRTYGHPRDHTIPITPTTPLDDPNIVWSAPGPTFVLSKATTPGRNDGTNFIMDLFNRLEPQEDPHACDELVRVAPNPQGPFTPDTEPNCFHGDNSTNFHFHGFHVSPQPHQDWVGLELLPFGATAPEHAVHTRGAAVVGEYHFDVDRLRYTQAEGTHWYHAHKHGATALQVLNGLVGTFEIRGSFDTELEALYQGQLVDRLLVVQQLQETLSGLGNVPNGSPDPLINGMGNPILRMKPGETQRWRFVGATMQASAQLSIGFQPGPSGATPEVRQIAMDGVQFAPQNYRCQPVFNGPGCNPVTGSLDFSLDPGNRIDILIKAPATPGHHVMTYEILGKLGKEIAAQTRARDQAKVASLVAELTRANASQAAVDEPALLTLIVEGAPVESEFPTEDQFPRMPAYLADLQPPFQGRTIAYQMANQANLNDVRFSICDAPYDPSCVNETLTLDVNEEWLLTNNSGIAHPFHIHTNPFQMVSDAQGPYDPPYVWRDVIAIPTGSDDDLGEALVRYVAKEFTGEFVNHCHILGHEDRGMMHNVQTVCANDQWGRPTSNLEPECRDGNYIPSAPRCTTGLCPPTS